MPSETRPLEPGQAVARADTEESAIPSEELERLSGDIVGALKTVFDPEIPADIYELGLIYRIDID
ncbi:MAG: iron-sulfur cluster assembly protein, partial [Alphaproteobacteria bacterium]